MLLLVPATDEAPQVGNAIRAVQSVVETLDISLDNTNTLLNPNANPIVQNKTGGGSEDTPEGGAGAGNNSFIRMPDNTNNGSAITQPEQEIHQPSLKKIYTSKLNPEKFAIYEDRVDVNAKGGLPRTAQQEEYRKTLRAGDHSRNHFLQMEDSKLNAEASSFFPSTPQANSTALKQPRPSSPLAPLSPMSSPPSTLYRTVRFQGTFLFIFFLVIKLIKF